jgi:hypothetical protein
LCSSQWSNRKGFFGQKLAVISIHVDVVRFEGANIIDEAVEELVAIYDANGIGWQLDAGSILGIVVSLNYLNLCCRPHLGECFVSLYYSDCQTPSSTANSARQPSNACTDNEDLHGRQANGWYVEWYIDVCCRRMAVLHSCPTLSVGRKVFQMEQV